MENSGSCVSNREDGCENTSVHRRDPRIGRTRGRRVGLTWAEKRLLTVKDDRDEQDDEGLSARDTERHTYRFTEVNLIATG
jgi:hypothetical protein